MKTPELKPCPFCGGENIYKSANTVRVSVGCVDCGAKISRTNGKQYKCVANCRRRVEPLAIEAWNMRC